jgi:hypothetical protein
MGEGKKLKEVSSFGESLDFIIEIFCEYFEVFFYVMVFKSLHGLI